MTAFTPPISMPGPTQQRGERIDDFVDRLSNPPPADAGGAVISFVLAYVSLGLLPLVIWPTRWAEFTQSERPDLLDLIAWWRRRVGTADARELDKIARKLQPRPMLMILPWLAAGFFAVLVAILLVQGDSPHRIWELTFQHAAPSDAVSFVGDGWTLDFALERVIYKAWIVSLFAGYCCQWNAVRQHAMAVSSLANFTNKLARENQFMMIRNDTLLTGVNWIWIVIGIMFCGQHAWWAIPMMMAGAMQRRYIRKSSPQIRMALAAQARDSFAIVPAGDHRFCNAGHCGARLPAVARFCSRCGTAV